MEKDTENKINNSIIWQLSCDIDINNLSNYILLIIEKIKYNCISDDFGKITFSINNRNYSKFNKYNIIDILKKTYGDKLIICWEDEYETIQEKDLLISIEKIESFKQYPIRSLEILEKKHNVKLTLPD